MSRIVPVSSQASRSPWGPQKPRALRQKRASRSRRRSRFDASSAGRSAILSRCPRYRPQTAHRQLVSSHSSPTLNRCFVAINAGGILEVPRATRRFANSLSTWHRRGRSRPAIRLKGRSAKRSFDFAMRRLVRRDFASGQDSLRGREHIVVANPCRD